MQERSCSMSQQNTSAKQGARHRLGGQKAHRDSHPTGSIKLCGIVGRRANTLQICECRIKLLGGLQHMPALDKPCK